MEFIDINLYNIYLVNNSINLHIIDYLCNVIIGLNPEFDKEYIYKMLNLNNNDKQFIITLNDLINYDIISNKEINIEEFINSNKLIKDLDYRLKKSYNKKDIKQTIIIDYIFTNEAIKKCLLNTNPKYLRYNLLLDKCILYYNEYQTNLLNKLILIKDIKVDNITNIINKQNEDIQNIKQLISYSLNDNNNINNNINNAHDKLDDIFYTLDNKTNNQNINIFGLFKIGPSKYYIIDCDKIIFVKTLKKKLQIKYNLFLKKIMLEYDSTSIILKYKILKLIENKVIITNSMIELKKDYNENDLILYINKIINSNIPKN